MLGGLQAQTGLTCPCRVVLQTILLGGLQVATLVLRHLDLPAPGGGGAGVDVEGDGHTGVGGGDPHVLARVVAAHHWRGCEPRRTDWTQTVITLLSAGSFNSPLLLYGLVI